jgi:tetratricopeptide (TPR) repeat protein
LSEGQAHLARALEENPGSSPERALALAAAGDLALTEGRLDDAHGLAREALAIARAVGDRRAEAYALRDLGVEALRRRPSAQARALLEESRRVAEAIHRPSSTGVTDLFLGDLAETLGGQDEARQRYLRAERTMRETGHVWGLAWAQRTIGELALHQNAFTEAEWRLAEAEELARQIDSRQLVVLILLAQGNAAYRADDQDLAGLRHERAMEAMARLDETTSLSLGRAAMAKVAVSRGDLGAARRWLNSVDVHDPLLRREARAQIRRSRGRYLAAVEQFHEAEAEHLAALRLWDRLHDHRRLIEELESLALMASRTGRWERAAALYSVTSAARERAGVAPPPVYRHEIEALAATLAVRGHLDEVRRPVPSVAGAVTAVLGEPA